MVFDCLMIRVLGSSVVLFAVLRMVYVFFELLVFDVLCYCVMLLLLMTFGKACSLV